MMEVATILGAMVGGFCFSKDGLSRASTIINTGIGLALGGLAGFSVGTVMDEMTEKQNAAFIKQADITCASQTVSLSAASAPISPDRKTVTIPATLLRNAAAHCG